MGKLLVEFRRRIKNKRFFVAFAAIGFAVPESIVLVWNFGRYVGVGFSVYIVIVSFAAGLLAGYLMWKYFVWYFNWGETDLKK